MRESKLAYLPFLRNLAPDAVWKGCLLGGLMALGHIMPSLGLWLQKLSHLLH